MPKRGQKEEFEFSTFAEPHIVAEYLESLASALRNGTVRLTSGGEEMYLTPEGAIELDVEAKKKEGKAKLVLKLSWEKKAEMTAEPLLITIEREPVENEVQP
jgi:amphi-Trp domain-containing protein